MFYLLCQARFEDLIMMFSARPNERGLLIQGKPSISSSSLAYLGKTRDELLYVVFATLRITASLLDLRPLFVSMLLEHYR